MGVASLVLGIVSLVIGFIPLCGMIAFVPAVVGVILGAVDFSIKKKAGQPKGMAIAGLILSIIAIVIMLYYYFVVLAGIGALGEVAKELNSISTNYTYYNSI